MNDSVVEVLKDYSRLFRVPMLLLIVAFQLMIYFFVVTRYLESYGIAPSMSVLDCVLLVLATLFFTAGGYVINDYFDMKIDQINRPLTRVVGRRLDKNGAMSLYRVLTIIGAVFSILLCWRAQSFQCLLILLFVAGILWFYSSNYKRSFFIGNFIAAFMMALVPLVVVLFQNQFMLLEYNMNPDLMYIMKGLLIYGVSFSFVGFAWTFILEVVNDLISVKGDRELECHTFPVVWGVQKTKWLLYGCLTLMLVLSALFFYFTPSLHSSASLRFYVCGFFVPALSLFYIISKSQSPADYKLVLNYVMVIFAVNIAYIFVLDF
jgi:4-hydroxybenzoate polyprenyltransferase